MDNDILLQLINQENGVKAKRISIKNFLSFIYIYLVLVSIISCNEKRSSIVNISYIRSYYKNSDQEVIDFCRIIKIKSKFQLIEGNISYDKNFNTIQKISNCKFIKSAEVDSIKFDLVEKGYREKFDNYENVIFLQMRLEFTDDLSELDTQRLIDEKISIKLSNYNLGSWIASDIGPGGVNLLYEVKDYKSAMRMIIKILEKEKILDKSIIAKRLYFEEDDWNYEIIYPVDFNGIFNQS